MSQKATPSLLERFPIRAGAHPTRGDGLCAMEMVAWLAGEEHSDGPACTCPTLAALVRAFNDSIPDDRLRSRYLRPLIPRLVNTRGTRLDEQERGFLVADYAVRVLAPQVLRRHGRGEEAERLQRLPAVRDRATALLAHATCVHAGPLLRDAAWIAARAAGTLPPAVWVGALPRLAGSDAGRRAILMLIEQLLAVGDGTRLATARP